MKLLVDDPDFTLYLGDALEVLSELPEESVNCCVTSPPYWGLRDYGDEGQIGLEETPEEYVEKIASVFAEVRRVLRPDGTCWLNLGDGYAKTTAGGDQYNIGNVGSRFDLRHFKHGLKEKDLVGIPWKCAFALQAEGWYLRSEIIWSKPNPTPESADDRPTRSHEQVFMLTKSPDYFYDGDAIAAPAKGTSPHVTTAGRRAVRPAWGDRKTEEVDPEPVERPGKRPHMLREQRLIDNARLGENMTRHARSVWTIRKERFPDAHHAVFPVELPRRCIVAGCPLDGTVIDPFLGSGTTSIAARRLGRRSIGIELSLESAKLAAKQVALG